jgi:hypothetical protein
MIRNAYLKLQCFTLAAAILFGSLALSGCQGVFPEKEESGVDQTESEPVASTANTLPAATVTPVPSPTPAPLSDSEAEPEALRIAEEAGLSKEDLRGKYAFFLRYSEAVMSNAGILEYRNYLYKFFPVVADHIKSGKEDYFIGKLGSLGIYTVRSDEYAGALFRDYVNLNADNLKDWGEQYNDLVIYHELMHFIDAAIDGEVGDVFVMKDRSFKCYPESVLCQFEDFDYYYASDVTYFVEGGAEKYKTEYFSKSGMDENPAAVEFLVGLEYLFGKETVDDMYFCHDTGVKFCYLLRENGFSDEDIIRVLRTTSTEDGMYDRSMYIDPREVLIRLYTQKIGPDYEKDAKFCRIIAGMDKKNINEIPTDYKDFITKVTKESNKETKSLLKAARKKAGNQDIEFLVKPYPFFYDGELKLVTMYYTFDKKDRIVLSSAIFDYDFEKKSVKGVELVKSWAPKKLKSQEKLSKEEADAVVSKLYNDNSEAHNQKVVGKNPELTIQYKQAETLGKKHGVYFWFDDLKPEDVMPYEKFTASNPEDITNTLNKISRVLSYYPKDYFDQLLFEFYDGIVICLYSGPLDQDLPRYYYSNGKSYLLFYVNVSYEDLDSYNVVGYPGAEKILAQFHGEVSAAEAQLVCDIWRATESVMALKNRYYEKPAVTESDWTSKNYKGFKYLEYGELNKLYDYEGKTNMDYFLDKGALYSSANDRVLTYEYMMLFTMTEQKPDGLTEECRAKIDEIRRAIRQEFDTTNWPALTSWERALIKL